MSKCKIPQKFEELRAVVSPVRNYRHSLRNNPAERISHLLRGGSLQTFENSSSATAVLFQADRQMDGHDEANNRFSKFCERALKNSFSTTLPIETYLNKIYNHQNLSQCQLSNSILK